MMKSHVAIWASVCVFILMLLFIFADHEVNKKVTGISAETAKSYTETTSSSGNSVVSLVKMCERRVYQTSRSGDDTVSINILRSDPRSAKIPEVAEVLRKRGFEVEIENLDSQGIVPFDEIAIKISWGK